MAVNSGAVREKRGDVVEELDRLCKASEEVENVVSSLLSRIESICYNDSKPTSDKDCQVKKEMDGSAMGKLLREVTDHLRLISTKVSQAIEELQI